MFDVYRAVTDRIVLAIEAGDKVFVMRWHSHGAPLRRPLNAATGFPYGGISQIVLWAEAQVSRFGPRNWATLRQWQRLGASVRKCERPTPTVYYTTLHAGDPDARLENDERGPPMVARATWVFNARQVEGWAPRRASGSDRTVTCAGPLVSAEAFVAAAEADVPFGPEFPGCWPSEDVIEMPDRSLHVGPSGRSPTEVHYATLLYETVRRTVARHRANNGFGERFGGDADAMEALVTELGAAFLCSALSVANVPRPGHAAHVASWLKFLKGDHRAIFSIARYASSAVECLTKPSASP